MTKGLDMVTETHKEPGEETYQQAEKNHDSRSELGRGKWAKRKPKHLDQFVSP